MLSYDLLSLPYRERQRQQSLFLFSVLGRSVVITFSERLCPPPPPPRPTQQHARRVGSRARLAEALAGRAAAFQESGAVTAASILRLFFSGSAAEGCCSAKVKFLEQGFDVLLHVAD